jgi:RND family efflux transporter MFP subunit
MAALWATSVMAQPVVEVVKVVAKSVDRHVNLPGELSPYLRADLLARVTGFVETVEVDIGSIVTKGQLLATLTAPEMAAQVAEAKSKVLAVESQRAEAQAKLVAARSTYQRMKAAAETPGAVAENELIQAQQAVDAAVALVRSIEEQITAGRSTVTALAQLQEYLKVTAPFDGVITQRMAHPGALAGPSQSAPLLRIEQLSRLRLTVAVPEAEVGGIATGARVSFTAAPYPGRVFSGVISRIGHSLEVKTRSMAVELDVPNPGLKLSPGMYADVRWPVRRPGPVLLVPSTSLATTTEKVFVIRVKDEGIVEWVNVSRGAPAGDLIEVHGPLRADDVIARRGTDELREGSRVKTKAAAPPAR